MTVTNMAIYYTSKLVSVSQSGQFHPLRVVVASDAGLGISCQHRTPFSPAMPGATLTRCAPPHIKEKKITENSFIQKNLQSYERVSFLTKYKLLKLSNKEQAEILQHKIKV